MTGLLPVAHGVRDNGVVFAPQASAPTLARRLQDAGYRTGAFVGAYVLDRRFGLADGFDTYDDRIRRNPDEGARLEAERRGGEVVDAAAGVAEPDELVAVLPVGAPLRSARTLRAARLEYPEKAGGNAYDGEVAYADAQVARLVDVVAGARRAGVDGRRRGRRSRRGPRRSRRACARDAGVRLDAEGAARCFRARPMPARVVAVARVARRSRADAVASWPVSRPPGRAPICSHRNWPSATSTPRRSTRASAGWHALVGARGRALEAHSVVRDRALRPVERSRRAAERCRGARRRRAGHDVAPDGIQAAVSRRHTAAVAAEATERLRALGYVSGSATPAGVDPRAPNPARVIDAWAAFETALAQVNGGRAQDALPALKDLAGRFPDALGVPDDVWAGAQGCGASGGSGRRVPAGGGRAFATRASITIWRLRRGRPATCRKPSRPNRRRWRSRARNPAALNGLGLLHAEAGRATEAAGVLRAGRDARSVERVLLDEPRQRAARAVGAAAGGGGLSPRARCRPDVCGRRQRTRHHPGADRQAGGRGAVVRARGRSRRRISTRRGSISALPSRKAASASAPTPSIERSSPRRRPRFTRERAAAGKLLNVK